MPRTAEAVLSPLQLYRSVQMVTGHLDMVLRSQKRLRPNLDAISPAAEQAVMSRLPEHIAA